MAVFQRMILLIAIIYTVLSVNATPLAAVQVGDQPRQALIFIVHYDAFSDVVTTSLV